MEILSIFSAFGLSASAGLNAYIPLLVVGVIAHYTDWLHLTEPFDLLANPWVLIVIGVLAIVEMVADKIPAVNHINDAIMTLVRPAAGAIVFAASANIITDVNPILALILGLFIAGGVHAVKAVAVRPAVTATTGGMANTPVSIIEDVVATVLSVLAVVLPVLMAVFVVLLVALLAWWLWRRAQKRKAGA
jgi:uncharacterized membrane protein